LFDLALHSKSISFVETDAGALFNSALIFFASALWDKGYFPFSCVKFYRFTTSRTSKNYALQNKQKSIIKFIMVCAKASPDVSR
jgi:hypothetical protein